LFTVSEVPDYFEDEFYHALLDGLKKTSRVINPYLVSFVLDELGRRISLEKINDVKNRELRVELVRHEVKGSFENSHSRFEWLTPTV